MAIRGLSELKLTNDQRRAAFDAVSNPKWAPKLRSAGIEFQITPFHPVHSRHNGVA
jgi:hypothetical protein